MKSITLKIILTDDNKIASAETCTNLPVDKTETHLLIVGLLENMKQRHLEKLNTTLETTFRKDDAKDKLRDL